MAHGIGNHRQFLALGFQLRLFRLTICWAAVGGGAIAILRHKHAEGLLTSPTSGRCIETVRKVPKCPRVFGNLETLLNALG
jgi:hypothetical protein